MPDILASCRLLVLLLVASPALASDPAVQLRVAAHDGFTRLVFDAPGRFPVTIQRDRDQAIVAFAGPAAAVDTSGFDPRSLRNLVAIRFRTSGVALTLRPGVALHSFAIGSRQVLDLYDPPMSPSRTVTRLNARRVESPPPVTVADIGIAAIAVAVTPEPAAQTMPVVRIGGPAPERQIRPAAEPSADGPAAPVRLAFAATTGAAAFRRGGVGIVVFDERRAIDTAALRAQPGFESANVELLPQATVLKFTLPPGRAATLSHSGPEWSIALGTDISRPDTSMALAIEPGRLRLSQAHVGQVISVADPLTGDTLLVGTARDVGPHMERARRFAQFELLPTSLGVAIDPLAERLVLTPLKNGYAVESSQPGESLSLQPTAMGTTVLDAARLTRSFDLPNQAAPALLRRLESQVADAAAAPIRARLPFRRSIAQTMLALGLGPEAQGVLTVAAEDDPGALVDPQSQTLAAAGALLAGRLDETGALAQVNPPETDEHRLWRGLQAAARLPDGSTPDAETSTNLAANIDLLLTYPPTLQRSLLPLAADTLLRGGKMEAARRLLDSLPDDALDLARAAALHAQGQTEAALAAFDRLGQSRDRSVRARALAEAIDLRVATGKLTPAAAAEAGSRLLYSWRGDSRDRDLRLRIATWQGQAGQFRQQLETLRETLAAFPASTEGVRDRLTSAFSALLQQGGGVLNRIKPFDLVALVQENSDLLPDGPPGESIASQLADQLQALDLPLQAEKVLGGMITRATPAARAALGARLAALELADGQAQSALQALDQSEPSGAVLTPMLREQRSLLRAHADTALGNRPAALSSLAALSDQPALLARVQVYEEAHDWIAASAQLATLAATALPSSGPLNNDQSALLLRWAGAIAQAGDESGLAQLRARYTGRLSGKDDAALLAVLTEPPIHDAADLPRAAAETVAARVLTK